MRFAYRRLHSLLLVITILPVVLMASAFLFWGVHGLVNPFVPEELLAENTLVCAVLIVTAAILIYALFRPYWGGFLLCIWAVPFGFILYALRPSREAAGYHPILPP